MHDHAMTRMLPCDLLVAQPGRSGPLGAAANSERAACSLCALPPVGQIVPVQEQLVTPGRHRFDGDGTVHAVRIKDGAAAYCNAWVDTARLRQERAAGFPQFIKASALSRSAGCGAGFASYGQLIPEAQPPHLFPH